MRMNKKGILQFGDMAGVALLFVVVGASLGIGAMVLSNIQGMSGFTNTSSAEYVTLGNASSGIANLSSWLPIIGVILAASVVIGTLMFVFTGGQDRAV